ncbi:MAG: hypothetical protein IKZ51_09960 [Bacteroidales bacterium]|nr:hypothetical protein [Bacteroidales bacterium]
MCPKLVFSCAVILFVLPFVESCQKDSYPSYSFFVSEEDTKSSINESKYIFNTSTHSWMQEEKDPFELSNIRTLAEDKIDSVNIVPTHYAIKIYPRDEAELNELVSTNDIVVSFIPFGYIFVPDEVVSELNNNKTIHCRQYTENVKYYINGDGDNAIPLPVLYVSWPVNKTIPDGYDYELLYSACLPSLLDDSVDNDGIRIANNVRGSSYRTISGFVLDYDGLLDKYLPMKNLRIRVSYGLSSIETYTNHAGHFSISGVINDNATVSIVYQNSQWQITEIPLITYVVSLGTVASMWGSTGSNKVIRTNTEAQLIHRAAEYFFNGNHEVTTPSSNYSLQILMTVINEGNFNANLLTNPWIEIELVSYFDDHQYFKVLMHEFGHFNHYKHTTAMNYLNVPLFIRESYAEYIKWILSPEYYISNNNGVYDSSWEFALIVGAQSWHNGLEEPFLYYSPLFVDLVDDYNQRVIDNSYNYDIVTGFTFDDITYMISNISSWEDLRSYLQSVITPSTTFASYIAPYDEYFSSNAN